jgi:copper chaperone CopZ
MQKESFEVQKVKCDGCATTIRDGLLKLPGIDTVEVEVSTGHVTVQGNQLSRDELADKLTALGYPLA